MFRKAFALVAAVLCASAASAAANMRVVNLAPYLSTTAPTNANNALTLKANTVYDFASPNGQRSYLVVKCPAAKTTNAKIQKAFTSYISISTGDSGSDMQIYDAADMSQNFGSIWANTNQGYGSIMYVTCINGRLVYPFNEEY